MVPEAELPLRGIVILNVLKLTLSVLPSNEPGISIVTPLVKPLPVTLYAFEADAVPTGTEPKS